MIDSQTGIQLDSGKSASGMLHGVLRQAVEAYPQALNSVQLPASAAAFRQAYIELLPEFETARIASKQRSSIAGALARALEDHLIYRSSDHSLSLAEYMNQTARALPLEHSPPVTPTGWQPAVPYRGRTWNSTSALGEVLLQDGVLTPSASAALAWLESHAMTAGRISLADRKIVVIGANAEMAPTRYLLATGADVLWLDLAPPPPALVSSTTPGGRLSWIRGNADLLNQPGEILATIIDFSDGEPVDLCLFAYAPGQARELRLTGAMNGIVNALPPALIRSVTMLLSPTTATPLGREDLEAIDARRSNRPAWEALLDSLNLLGRGGGCARQNDVGATRTVVGIQGASYQAAQYLGKLMMAECWATQGQTRVADPVPLRVSANTAAITRTRSMSHPVFDAAFGGAGALQVETFTPEQSRCINGLLAIHDWLNPDMPQPASIRVHGGIHSLPYPLNTALRTAALIGFLKSPGLLLKLVRH